jgi:hypothetical protein
LALEVVGQLDPSDGVALEAHLDGCPHCRNERAELAPLRTVLPAADPTRDEPAPIPARLGEAVVTRLRAEARRDRRLHGVRATLLSGAAAAVLAGAGVVLGLHPGSSAQGSMMALSGPPGVHATVTLFPEPWGTRLALDEAGQPGGQILTVSMRGRGGRWWSAGTYRTVAGRPVHADLACAARKSDIYLVVVRDAQGRTVLKGETV